MWSKHWHVYHVSILGRRWHSCVELWRNVTSFNMIISLDRIAFLVSVKVHSLMLDLGLWLHLRLWLRIVSIGFYIRTQRGIVQCKLANVDLVLDKTAALIVERCQLWIVVSCLRIITLYRRVQIRKAGDVVHLIFELMWFLFTSAVLDLRKLFIVFEILFILLINWICLLKSYIFRYFLLLT